MRKIGNMISHKQIALFILLSLASISFAQPKVTATIDARQVLVQESFTWKVEVEGSEEMPQIRLPNIEKVALLSGPMQSSNYTYVNGKMSSKKTLSYTFAAMEPGSVTIPAVDVYLGRKKYRTKPLKLTIVAARNAQGNPAAAGQSVYLRALPSKTTIYVGEPISVRYKLFTKVGVYNYQVDKLPDAVGFWAEEIPQSSQPRLVSEVIDGVRYNTAVLKTVLYYPTRSGDLVIDPLNTELEIEVKSNQRGNRRFNDPFFNDPFFSGKRKANKKFVSNPLTIHVMSLPDPRPANFSGAVGNFKIQAGLDTNAVFANDAVGLSIKLTGSGNFKSLKLPEPELPEAIDVFKPERTENVKIRNMKHNGTKKSTYLLVPRTPGAISIDPIEFTYFDLNSKKYVTRSSGKLDLTVYDAEGTLPVVTSGYSREEVELMQEDIRYIKAADTHFVKAQTSPLGLGFWSWHLIGVLAIALVYGMEMRSNQLQDNVELRRRANAVKLARKRLQKAEKLAEDSEELRALLHQCITGFIGARLNVAENSMDTAEFTALLEERGISEELITKNKEFLEGLVMDRFAPSAVQRTASEWISYSRELLQELRKAL